MLAAAADPRIQKVWLDKTPYSFLEALQNTLNTDLYDAVIPGFALHWDLEDLSTMMGRPQVIWTDPTNWMGRVLAGPRFQYRWVLGDITDQSDDQDIAYARELLEWMTCTQSGLALSLTCCRVGRKRWRRRKRPRR